MPAAGVTSPLPVTCQPETASAIERWRASTSAIAGHSALTPGCGTCVERLRWVAIVFATRDTRADAGLKGGATSCPGRCGAAIAQSSGFSAGTKSREHCGANNNCLHGLNSRFRLRMGHLFAKRDALPCRTGRCVLRLGGVHRVGGIVWRTNNIEQTCRRGGRSILQMQLLW